MSCPVERLPPGARRQPGIGHVGFKLAEEQMLGVEMVEQRAQPVEEEIVDLIAGQVHVDFPDGLHGGEILDDGAEKTLSRLDEQRVEIGRADAQPQVSGVFEEFVHGRVPIRRSPINNAKCKTENAKCKISDVISHVLHFAFSVLHFALLALTEPQSIAAG